MIFLKKLPWYTRDISKLKSVSKCTLGELLIARIFGVFRWTAFPKFQIISFWKVRFWMYIFKKIIDNFWFLNTLKKHVFWANPEILSDRLQHLLSNSDNAVKSYAFSKLIPCRISRVPPYKRRFFHSHEFTREYMYICI